MAAIGKGRNRLLREIMADQPWDDPEAAPPVAFYQRALSGRAPALTPADEQRLLLSPAARLHHAQARDALRRIAAHRLARAGVETEARRLAAATEADTFELRSADFTLAGQRDEEGADPEWLLLLRLSDRICAALDGLPLRLLDEEGLVWLEGWPDASGTLGGVWTEHGTPMARLARMGVRIEGG
ncbi:hypothetical protein [Falsiroseomonas ponticola]|uniref:hypothetical protein n=1 Tax=Falsiroseomonas ponticola TaxID=2786951 RepID=UPI001933DDD4|nr:hypothetical protein [Roseomonas ponticola]